MSSVIFGYQNLVNIVTNVTPAFQKMEELIGIATNVEDVLKARGNIAKSVKDAHYQNIHASFILKRNPSALSAKVKRISNFLRRRT